MDWQSRDLLGWKFRLSGRRPSADDDVYAPNARRFSWFGVGMWVVLATAVVFFVIGWFLSAPFWRGEISSIYWVYIIYHEIVFPFTIAIILILIVLWLYVLERWYKGQPTLLPKRFGRYSFLACALLIMASSRLFIQTFEHYDQARYNNRIYYLMREAAWFDMNLVLFECDGLGIMCQKVYTKNFDTDEQQEQAKTAYLSIDSASNRLSIQAEDGEVFYKILPP